MFWNLAQTITWIMTQDENEVAKAPNAVVLLAMRELGELFEHRTIVHLGLLDTYGRVGEDLGVARAKLWGALQSGEIEATGLGPDGERRRIQAELWQDLEPMLHGRTEVLQRCGLRAGPMFTETTIRADSVRRYWPATPPPTLPKNMAEQVAILIKDHWPNGRPAGMKIKDFDNAIINWVRGATGSTVSARTVKRARDIANF